MKHVFAYGTLMFNEVAFKVIGCITSEKAVLKNYKRYKIERNNMTLPYPGLQYQAGEHTNGRLLKNLSDAQIEQLDRYEGTDYYRKSVTVETQDGTTSAEVYIWKENTGAILLDDWDPDYFFENQLSDFLNSDDLNYS